MKNKVGDLWNRIFEMSERLMDKDLTEEELRSELARMDGLYKASKSVIDMTNAVTRMRVMEKTEDIALPDMFTNMGETPTPIPACMPDVPVETGRRPPLLSGRGGVA